MISKEKIDQMLGIPTGQSVDDFLDEMTKTGDVNALSATFDKVKTEVAENSATIDSITSSDKPLLQMSTLETSMMEIEDLVTLSKNMFKHIYEQIITSSLLDSEAIAAAAKLLESIHINIAEFISVYHSKIKFYELMQKMNVQHQFDLEKMKIRHEYDLEKISKRQDAGAIQAEEGKYPTSFEDMIRLLQEAEDKNTSLEAELEDTESKVNSSNNELENQER